MLDPGFGATEVISLMAHSEFMRNAKEVLLLSAGSGFLGRTLLERRDLPFEVWGLTRRSVELSPRTIFSNSEEYLEKLPLALSALSPSVLLLNTALYSYAHRTENFNNILDSNFSALVRLLESMPSSIRKVIFLGSIQQFDESNNRVGGNLYAACKNALESVLEFYAKYRGVHVHILYLPDIYGPGGPKGKIVDALFMAALGGTVIQMSKGEQTLYLLHVEDFARAVETVISIAPHPGRVDRSWVGPNDGISLANLVRMVERVVGKSIASLGSLPYREGQVFHQRPPVARLSNWSPACDLEISLEDIWRNYNVAV